MDRLLISDVDQHYSGRNKHENGRGLPDCRQPDRGADPSNSIWEDLSKIQKIIVKRRDNNMAAAG